MKTQSDIDHVPDVPLDQQNTLLMQSPSSPSYHASRTKRIAFCVAAGFLIVVAAVWIVNALGFISGPWKEISLVLFTLFSAVLALYGFFFSREGR